MHHLPSPISRWIKLRCITANNAFDVYIAPNGSAFLSTEDVASYVDVMFGLYPGIEFFLSQLQELPCTKEIVIESLSDIRNSIKNRYEHLFTERKSLTASCLSKEKYINRAGESLETREVLNFKHKQYPNLLQKDTINCPSNEISLTETCGNLPLFNNEDVKIEDSKYSFDTEKSHIKINEDVFETNSLSKTFFVNDGRDSDYDITRLITSSTDQLLSDSSETKDSTDVAKNEHDCGSCPLVKEPNDNFVYSSDFKRKNVIKKVKRESLSPYFKKTQSSKVKRQSGLRGVHTTIRYVPMSSPFNLIQERLYMEPWQLLAATIFLNKTSATVALPLFWKFVSRFSKPQDVSEKDFEEISGV